MIAASLLMVSLWLPKNSNASTAQVPYYLRELKDQKDIGAVNENFRNLSDYMTKLGETVDADSGGNAKLESDQTWTGTNQFSTVTFSITPSSTTTLPLNQTTVFSAGFVCIATVTYSAQGSMVGVFLNGGDGIASSGYEIYFWVLVDGSIPSPYGVTRAMVQKYGGTHGGWDFGPIPLTVSSGFHSYCFAPVMEGGTWNYNNNTIPIFGVKEWR